MSQLARTPDPPSQSVGMSGLPDSAVAWTDDWASRLLGANPSGRLSCSVRRLRAEKPPARCRSSPRDEHVQGPQAGAAGRGRGPRRTPHRVLWSRRARRRPRGVTSVKPAGERRAAMLGLEMSTRWKDSPVFRKAREVGPAARAVPAWHLPPRPVPLAPAAR